MTDAQTARLAAAYSEIAPYYARLWSPVLLPMGRQLLERLPLAGAGLVIDLGAGTGTLLADLVRSAPAATVVGVDLAEGMLRFAAGEHDVPLAVTDARTLPLPDGSVDVVVSAFVLFNIPDPEAAMREVRRVLRPGGSFGMTTWGDEPDDPVVEIWAEELEAHGSPAPEPATDGRELMDTTSKLGAMLADQGFTRVETWSERLNFTWKPQDYLEFLQHGKTKARLDALEQGARADCLATAARRFGELTAEQLTERSEVVFATAVA